MKEIFPAVIGNEELCARFARALLSDKPDLPHAYIIEGAYGTGKHTLALELARALVCENRTKPEASALPCGECRSCRNIARGACPDVVEIHKDGASVGVDAIRSLRNDIHIYPNDLERKIYIINDAHTMTAQAQNALLLTLEEPPEYAFILLLCENSTQLLETIKSRAPTVRMKPLTPEQTEEALLRGDPSAANVKRTDPSLWGDVIMSANGSPGLAADLLTGKEAARIAEVRRASEKFCALASDKAKSAALLIHVTECCTQARETAREQLESFSLAVRDLILLKRDTEAPLRFWSDRDRALELSDSFALRRLLTLSDAILEAISSLERNMNTKLTLVSMLSKLGMLN
ncbi:MAG: ATP-binding protein [Eubacteriales bacterium]